MTKVNSITANSRTDAVGSILGFCGPGPKKCSKFQIHYFVISLVIGTYQIDHGGIQKS